ncbi:hypothetical protein [Parapedobacter lycopersici]|uniref:hypothetical protein n=1 Tax=Parapedobacter lycopersici TaxID=1864939 RepID=UPI00214DD9F9|nr:hypothetical protein [Parapedobacter lycopersici]
MELFIKFTDSSESFTNGVEFGRLLNKMERGDENVSNNGFPCHIENMEVLESACLAYGYIPVWGKDHYGEWVDFMGIKKVAGDN